MADDNESHLQGNGHQFAFFNSLIRNIIMFIYATSNQEKPFFRSEIPSIVKINIQKKVENDSKFIHHQRHQFNRI